MMKRYTLLNDLLFRKLFTTEGNQYILLQFINDITGMNFESIILRETYRIDTYMAQQNAKFEQYEQTGELFETIVDLSGQLSDGTMVSIELQVKNHYKFIERSLYYTANTYVNQYTKNQKYATLKPTISINIINFPLHRFEESTVEKFVLKNENNEPLLSTDDRQLLTVVYFSLMNETREKIVNDWRKLFLHLDIDEDAQKVIQDANQMINYQQLSEVEKMLITKEEKMRADFEAIREYELSEREKEGVEKGIKKGMEKGRIDTLIHTARNMLMKRLDVGMISEVTGLSVEEIERITM